MRNLHITFLCSITKTLERYQHCCYNAQDSNNALSETQVYISAWTDHEFLLLVLVSKWVLFFYYIFFVWICNYQCPDIEISYSINLARYFHRIVRLHSIKSTQISITVLIWWCIPKLICSDLKYFTWHSY